MSGIGIPYRLPSSSDPLRQGEILAAVAEYLVTSTNSASEGEEETVTTQIRKHPLVVVLTQDCDLAQDFAARNSTDPKLLRLRIQNVLLCQVDLANNLKTDGSISPGSDIWKRIVQNKDERYQYLRAVPAEMDGTGQGIDSLLCDLKRIFTLPTEVLYAQLLNGTAVRRTVLVSPFMEHLCDRHAGFLSRVALPLDHHNDLPTPQSPA